MEVAQSDGRTRPCTALLASLDLLSRDTHHQLYNIGYNTLLLTQHRELRSKDCQPIDAMVGEIREYEVFPIVQNIFRLCYDKWSGTEIQNNQ